MLFNFQKYVSPIWYFHLKPDGSHPPYYVDIDRLRDHERNLVDCCDSYSSERARKKDAAYQALIRGVIHQDSESELKEAYDSPELDPSDNYRFLRRFYSRYWSIYVLMVRLLMFHNPIRELQAYWSTSGVKRLAIYDRCPTHDEYDGFQSTLVSQQPKVTVIIPTLNRYDYLYDAIKDLESQTQWKFRCDCRRSDGIISARFL